MDDGEKEGVYVQGMRVPITESGFQSLCDFHDEGTFMARCGLWHKMDKKLVDILNGGPDLLDEISDAKMLCNEDQKSHCCKGNMNLVAWSCAEEDQAFSQRRE